MKLRQVSQNLQKIQQLRVQRKFMHSFQDIQKAAIWQPFIFLIIWI
jgi:hypothetical protein